MFDLRACGLASSPTPVAVQVDACSAALASSDCFLLLPAPAAAKDRGWLWRGTHASQASFNLVSPLTSDLVVAGQVVRRTWSRSLLGMCVTLARLALFWHAGPSPCTRR